MFSSNLDDHKKEEQLLLVHSVFIVFLDTATGDPHALFAALVPPSEGCGKACRQEGSHSPLESLLGVGFAGQFSLHSGKQKEVGQCQIQQICWVLYNLESPGNHSDGSMAAVCTWA